MNGLTVKFLLLVIIQILLWNYFNFSQFLMIAILPAMILCLPVRKSAPTTMLISFVTGIAVDFLCTGRLGLTSFALVPVAFVRRPLIQLVFGSELYSRDEDISYQRQGTAKMSLATALATAIFLLIYICVDSAGTRPLWIDAAKFAASLASARRCRLT